MLRDLGDRLFDVDIKVIDHWARLMARLERAGKRMPAVDSLIAATALAHGLVLVTRNVAGFEAAGVRLHNPWT